MGKKIKKSSSLFKELFEAYRANFKHPKGYHEYWTHEGNDPYGNSFYVIKIKSGYLCFHSFDEHYWDDGNLIRKVLFSNGSIFHNHKKVVDYQVCNKA